MIPHITTPSVPQRWGTSNTPDGETYPQQHIFGILLRGSAQRGAEYYWRIDILLRYG